MKRILKAGAVDQTIDIFIPDSSATDGSGKTGLVHNTGSLVCYYRKGATGTPTQLSLVTQTVAGAHADGGFVAVDGTNMPGVYRLDLSDTIISAAGAVTIMLKGATDMAPVLVELQVVTYDPFTEALDVNVVSIDGEPAEDSGALATLITADMDANSTKLAAILDDTDDIGVAGIGLTAITDKLPAALVSGRIDASVGAMASNVMTAAALATDAVTEIQSGLATAAALAAVSALVDTEVAAILAAVDTEIAAIKAKTDNLPSDPADQSEINTLLSGLDTKINTIDDLLDTEIAALTTATSAASIRAALGLASANLDTQFTAIPAAAATGLLDAANGVETGFTVRQVLRLAGAAAAGKVSGAGTTSVAIRNLADTLNRIAATVDADGNRSAVTHNLG